ncbi:amino acid adenylation domain-containing protein [Lyngbya sp. CCAP 1446/10]|uniref:amino acid adenylation domain-containing protein n=1 Tax=Lyngbya sp. CCAP 1446/10 TaxID=439293 RepID=UPI002237E9B9|nr:amino acid adenylation domain-containing protein [Lyngbya sp. CCAP 1446/10]MCW6048552.1 amino acid adenylation domain-containing protein [Lyngbya sp. CCAP 1446/10]
MTKNVSVVIPSYNSAQFLPEAIESILEQTLPVFEIIVVDDGSTDETKEICDRYPAVKYVYQNNQGVAAARNTGLGVSTGEYIVFLDSDDCLLPEAIEIGVKHINALPEVGFVFGRYFFYSIQPDGSYKVEEKYEDQPEVANYQTILATQHKIQCGCIMFRRVALESVSIESVGAFDPSLVPMEDINLFLRVARDFPIYFHGEVVSKYRYTGNNLSSKSAKMLIQARLSHGRQWSYIQQTGKEEYIAAYEQGKRSWTKLFADRLPYEILRYIRAKQWVAALGILRLILYYDPKLQCIDREIYEISYTTLMSELRKLPLQDSLAYWQKQLAGATPLLPLPTDRPRPPEQSLQAASLSFGISGEITTALGRLGGQEGVALSTTLLAAFNILLYRYTGTEDVIVGSPFVGRVNSENFVNAVPLRTDMSGNPTFPEFLGRMRKVVLLGQAYQDVPYCLLVDQFCPQPDLSYSPLFQVTFVFEENIPFQRIDLSRLTASPWVIENNEGKFDLTLFLKPTSAGLEGSWYYSTDLFDAETIERMNEHFQILLSGIVAHPEQSISALPLLPDQEKNLLLVEWNQTQKDESQDLCLHQLIAQQAEVTPDKIAVSFEGQTLTYEELHQRSNQLANYLQQRGVKPDDLVGICVDRSLEMLVGLLGVLKAGGAYVPIDPNYPPDRVEYMIENSQAKVLLTQQQLVKSLPTEESLVICLDTDWPLIAQESQEMPIASVTPENMAYVIYTSGSTGKPKGVQVLHRGAVNFLKSMREQPGISATDILLSVTTLSFDIAVLELFLPLTVGAQVVILSREAAMDGRKLLRTIAQLGITILQATPVTWRLLLESGWEGQSPMKMLSGGEAIPKELAAQLLTKGTELWNMYGPTETTVWSTVYQIKDPEQRILIGKPIANTDIYILDSLLQPVPVGVAGELHIGGSGLARGYLQRDDLTTERFIPNPFRETERIYKTGDLARYLPDGNIECLGRLDFQVKIRGFRIELGEIESVLVKHSNVQQAVVIVREDFPGDKRLVGYIVALNNQNPSIQELRSLLKEYVPEYMVPSIFVFLEALPLTPNGKVDRKALPVPEQSREAAIIPATQKALDLPAPTPQENPEQPGEFASPQDDLEVQLINIWEQVLNISSISTTDNFFEMGGHSLLAISLMREIEKTYKKELPLPILFQSPTIHQLAHTLRKQRLSSSSQALVTIQKGSSKLPLFFIYGIFLYYNLSRHLGKDQTCYGVYVKEEVNMFQKNKLDQSPTPSVSIPELATRYLKEIQKHQPKGPYLLAGESLGGLVAFEMAHQLRLQGEEVALLCLLDSAIPGKNQLSLSQKLAFHIKKLRQKGLSYLLQKIVESKTKSTPDININNVNSNPVDPRLQFREYAFNSYKPQPYQGRAVLFRAKEESHFSTLENWKELLLEGLDIYDIPGDHLSILQEPNVPLLAEKMRVHIDQALAKL